MREDARSLQWVSIRLPKAKLRVTWDSVPFGWRDLLAVILGQSNQRLICHGGLGTFLFSDEKKNTCHKDCWSFNFHCRTISESKVLNQCVIVKVPIQLQLSTLNIDSISFCFFWNYLFATVDLSLRIVIFFPKTDKKDSFLKRWRLLWFGLVLFQWFPPSFLFLKNKIK